MKILLDECLPLDFRHSFPGDNVHTVQWAGLKSLKNGELLKAAETAGYDTLLTVDQGIPYERNTAARKIAIIVMRPQTNQLEDLLPLAELVLAGFPPNGPGDVVTLP